MGLVVYLIVNFFKQMVTVFKQITETCHFISQTTLHNNSIIIIIILHHSGNHQFRTLTSITSQLDRRMVG